MTETVLLIVLIVVLFLTTVISVLAMVKLRRRTKNWNEDKLDAGFDLCISELNKMGSLIKSDLDAKYKEVLFLYNLMEEKHKQVEALVSKSRTIASFDEAAMKVDDKEVMPAYKELYDFDGYTEPGITEPGNEPIAPAQSESDVPRSYMPHHQVILRMSERGLGIADIARELGIGQGEVKLILNIAGK